MKSVTVWFYWAEFRLASLFCGCMLSGASAPHKIKYSARAPAVDPVADLNLCWPVHPLRG
jgi:hypothetical protein